MRRRMGSVAALAFMAWMWIASMAGAQEVRAPERRMLLSEVQTFMYQLQNLEDPKSLEVLAKSSYDLVVVEPTSTVKGNENFDTCAMVAKLHAGRPGRIVLAYLNPCQAESYRTYWKQDWTAPTKLKRGSPDFLLIPDPDGWSDNYNVAFWKPAWQEVFATGKDSEIHRAMAAGFDGVYLDWIDAFDEPTVVAAAHQEGVDPVRAIVDWMLLIRKTAREVNPNAIVIQQNAIYLIDRDPRLKDAIDAVGVEDTWFHGKPNAKWNSKNAGDLPNKAKDEMSTSARLKQYAKLIAAGKPVLTIDYSRNAETAARIYREAVENKLIPLVTQVSLDHITGTPPPLFLPGPVSPVSPQP